jgi:hypothetical protein
VTEARVTEARVTEARVTEARVTEARVTEARVTEARVTEAKDLGTHAASATPLNRPHGDLLELTSFQNQSSAMHMKGSAHSCRWLLTSLAVCASDVVCERSWCRFVDRDLAKAAQLLDCGVDEIKSVLLINTHVHADHVTGSGKIKVR